VILYGDGTEYAESSDAWITIAEEVDWDNLSEYLEPIESHELNRLEAEELEQGDLSDKFYRERYGELRSD
jgi:hypothetical protein